MQPDDLAQQVVLILKGALSPIVERLAAAETRLAILADIRDRVVVLETKQAAPVLQPTWTYTGTAATSYIDAQLTTITDLESRVQLLERADAPDVPVEFGAINTRLSAVESLMKSIGSTVYAEVTESLQPIRDRVLVLETRAPVPGPAGLVGPIGPMGPAGKDGTNGIDGKDGAAGRDGVDGAIGKDGKDGAAGRDGLQGKDGAAGRDGIDGAIGAAGKDGRDGLQGKDGAAGRDGIDGLGFDDLGVEFDGDRTIAIKFARGATLKTFPLVLPFLKYTGVYQSGHPYAVGDVTTHAGQLWHCKEPTIAAPGDGSKLWQLCVRKGRDGKDGKDAAGALPVLTSAGRRAP